MRRLLVLVLVVAPAAWAQDPTPPAPEPERRWLVEETGSDRFGDGSLEGPTFRAGEEVTVLYTDAESVRVRKGTRYGWVPAAVLTDAAPASAEPTRVPVDIPMGGEFDLGALEALLKGSQAPE